MYDIIIIGAGPAGLTAAIYARRAAKTVLVLEASAYGGQIINTPDIENYPVAPNISGFDFATNIYNQAVGLGAEVKFEKALEIQNGDIKNVKTSRGEYEAKAAKTKKSPLSAEETPLLRTRSTLPISTRPSTSSTAATASAERLRPLKN